MSFRELINGFIGRFGELVGVKFDPLDEDGYASMRRGSAVIGLNVIEDRGVLILLAPTMRVPEQEQATFFRRLLELNLVATGDAAFAVDSQRSIVCLRALRGLQGMDFEAFVDLLDAVAATADEWNAKLREELGVG
ncbi:MAG: CesT family type III secretion system chaperone [Proteobacteria bacterium]|nr:CesT family type III secretion system chaperone [Pseudomonadota bacterium]